MKEETIANVVVLNDLGASVQGATVRLYAFCSVDADSVGELDLIPPPFQMQHWSASTFRNSTLKAAGFAVLDIEASSRSLRTGLIKIEEEKTNDATVYIE